MPKINVSKQQIEDIKGWIELGEVAGEWACPFGETSPGSIPIARNVGSAESGQLCAEIFPEIVPKFNERRKMEARVCCYVCPCNLLGYDEVYKRAKEFVDAH